MDLKIFTDNIEEKALEQVNTLASQEAFKEAKIRIMPDVHAGSGCVIGFTADLGDKVIPNVVGVDIGCGVLTIELGKVKIDLELFDKIVKRVIPSGFAIRNKAIATYESMIKTLICYESIAVGKWDAEKWNKQLGTLGGGNHFIELDQDKNGSVFLLIHTGSRNLGLQVANHYQNKAVKFWEFKDALELEKQEAIKRLKEEGKTHEIQEAIKNIDRKYKEVAPIIPKDLSYLMGDDRSDYLHDMRICQSFAEFNRQMIAISILDELLQDVKYKMVDVKAPRTKIDTDPLTFCYFDTVHNYIGKDNIVRKGAVSSYPGELLVIPINMRDGALICVGKGNKDWNNSAPHGAGRIMGRIQAKKTLNIKDFEESMAGIYSSTVNEGTLDEAPMVYKPIEEIINNIGDTVEIIRTIKPIYNFKASDLD